MDVIEYGNNWFIEDQLDNELLNDIKNFFDKNLEFLYNDKEGYSTTGHNAEQYWIKKKGNNEFLYKNKEYEDIERRFREGIHGRLKAASFLKTNNTQLNQGTAWTVIGEEGSYHTMHTHGDGFIDGISVVLYLNVPDSEDSKDSSNSICLVLHTDPSSNFLNKSCPSVYHIKPEVGKVLIFPYNIPHGTYPQTKGIRQTFNIDYWFSTKSESTLNYS
tara:strand:- start:211 stop:861 length:651 start_codon:yes stop_codon:yes gene_type:complete